MAIKKIIRSNFGVKQHNFDIPDLNSLQKDSYTRFWSTEFPKILKEFSPIVDPAGKFNVHLGPKFSIDVDSKMSDYKCLLERTSYTGQLFIDITVENIKAKTKKSQKVNVGRVPIMTPKGTFIINGVQKIIVSQLIKSQGVIFGNDTERGVTSYIARIIPLRGIWIDFSVSPQDGVIWVKVDKKKKFPATQLLRLFGLTDNEEIKALFAGVDTDENTSYIQNTLEKDETVTIIDAVNSIYKKIRPGDIISIEQGRKYLMSLFGDSAKYDFGEVGRYKFDNRLGYSSIPDKALGYKRVIDKDEIIYTMRELIRMMVQKEPPDEIDSLANRRIRAVGEWLSNTFKAGISRVVKHSKDKMVTHEDISTPAQIVNMRPLMAVIDDFFNTSQLSRFMDQTNLLSEMDQRQFMTCTGPGGLVRERAGFDVRDVQPSYYGRICPINTPESAAFGLNLNTTIVAKVNPMGFIETPYYPVIDFLKATNPSLIGRSTREEVKVGGERILKKGQFITEEEFDSLSKNHPKLNIPVAKHVSKKAIYLSADAEKAHIIAEHISQIDELGHILVPQIGARRYGEMGQYSVNDITLMDVTSSQILSLASSLIPFAAQTDGKRNMMATNQQGQAVPLVRPENPLVATGMETIAARDSGYMITSDVDGIITSADGNKGVTVLCDKTKKEKNYKLLKFLISNNHTAINQRIVVQVGERVKIGDILAEGFGVHNGEFAIGQNVRVAFMPFKGYNFEDAIVLSERLVQKDKFSSIHIHEFSCDVHETETLGNEEITRDIPNVSVDKLKKLDETGVIHLGAYVESGDILIGKITPKGEADLTPEDKLVRVLFGEYSRDVRDSSLYLEHGLSGKVVSVRVFEREKGDSLPNDVIKRVHVWVATTRKIKPGDKMSGRHGNKGVVSVVLPVEDMPYGADGRPVDMVLNSLGVIARMNLGQILETQLGLVCEKLDIHAITQPLNNISNDTIKSELVSAGFDEGGRVELWDGQTGEKYDRPVVVGNLYMNKLHHLVDDKIHSRSTGPYSLITQQPLGGRSHAGGQRFGEMEVWALEAYGAAHALQEMLTIKSDDVSGREIAFDSIVKEKAIESVSLPSSFVVLTHELTALGIKVKAEVLESEEIPNVNLELANFIESVDKKTKK
jgi:DNA-directed RNA polymerase subunit beta